MSLTEYEHNYWAKEILSYLISHLDNINGNIYITYKNLAMEIDYPIEPKGSYFGKMIGNTLGVMGHLIDGIRIDGEEIPQIQALVVKTSNKLPGDGLKEFIEGYENLSDEKKKDKMIEIYDEINKFGTRWYKLLDVLGIRNNRINEKIITAKAKYNPFGSEGSPEHRALIRYILENPQTIGILENVEAYPEYPLKSGDKIDIFFDSDHTMYAVEIKSRRSGKDDLERGLYQCIKYKKILEAENLVNNRDCIVETYLVIEKDLPKTIERIRKKLEIKVFENITSN